MSIIEILTAIFANIGQTNKPEVKIFIEIFELIFSIQGRHNFENWSRYSAYNESYFRRRVGRYFNWTEFNYALMSLGLIGQTTSQAIIVG